LKNSFVKASSKKLLKLGKNLLTFIKFPMI
jgi:hypothetical protein